MKISYQTILAFVFFGLGLLTQSTKAQQSNTLFLLHESPQSNLLNPAVQISCKWYVGIPALTSLQTNYSNTAFTFNQLISSSGINADQIYDQMHRLDLLSTELHLDLISIGYRRKDYYINFNIIEKTNIAFTYPKDLIGIALYGNGDFIGETAKINNIRIHGNHYREYSLGISKVLNHTTIAGARAKLLFGKSNIYSGKSQFSLTTDENTFNLGLEGDMVINSSFPLTVDQNADGTISGFTMGDLDLLGYLMNGKNKGFALDLGIIHRYDEKIQLSASILDLGFIKWKTDVNNITFNGSFNYTGAELGDNFTSDAYIFDLRDSLYDAFQIEATQNPYYTWLPLQVYLGGTYQWKPKIEFGLVNRNVIMRNKLHSSVSLLGMVDITKNIKTSLSWSYLNNSIKNVGLGVVLHGKGIQFHLISDNVLGLIKPLDTRTVPLRFGVNFMLGCPKNKKEELENSSKYSGKHEGNCYWLEKQNYKTKLKKKCNTKRQKKKLGII